MTREKCKPTCLFPDSGNDNTYSPGAEHIFLLNGFLNAKSEVKDSPPEHTSNFIPEGQGKKCDSGPKIIFPSLMGPYVNNTKTKKKKKNHL